MSRKIRRSHHAKDVSATSFTEERPLLHYILAVSSFRNMWGSTAVWCHGDENRLEEKKDAVKSNNMNGCRECPSSLDSLEYCLYREFSLGF